MDREEKKRGDLFVTLATYVFHVFESVRCGGMAKQATSTPRTRRRRLALSSTLTLPSKTWSLTPRLVALTALCETKASTR